MITANQLAAGVAMKEIMPRLKILKSKEEVEAKAAAKVSNSSVIKVQVKKKSKPGGQQQFSLTTEGDHSR